MSEKPDIIDDPKLAPSGRRAIEAVVTAAAWAGWLYLAMPLVTLLLWGVGIRTGIVQQTMSADIRDLGRTAAWYVSVTGVFILMMEIWGIYNRRRFGKLVRRREAGIVSDEETALALDVDSEAVRRAKHARKVRVSFDGSRPILEPLE